MCFIMRRFESDFDKNFPGSYLGGLDPHCGVAATPTRCLPVIYGLRTAIRKPGYMYAEPSRQHQGSCCRCGAAPAVRLPDLDGLPRSVNPCRTLYSVTSISVLPHSHCDNNAKCCIHVCALLCRHLCTVA